MFKAKTKHVKINFHFMFDNVYKGAFQIQHLFIKGSLVDDFINPLSKPQFQELCSKSCLRELPTTI